VSESQNGQSETQKLKLLFLPLLIYVFSFLAELIRETESVSKPVAVQRWVVLCVLVPSAFFETCFYYWIILSLIRTIQQLTLRRQTLKLAMYKWFFGVLAATGVFTFFFALYLLVLVLAPSFVNWQDDWIQDMFWEFLFLFTMISIAVLWRPRDNNTRYGYAEFFPDSEDPKDDGVDGESVIQLETLEIVGGGELTHRKRGQPTASQPINEPRYETEREQNIAKAVGPLPVVEESFIRSSEYFDLPDSDDGEDVSLDTQLKKLD